MTFLQDQELLSFNEKGLFPGPKESESEFFNRVHRLLSSSYSDGFACLDSLKQAKELFDIQPNWVQVEYTHLGLRFWEAAHVEVSPKTFKFRLRKSFLNHPKYLGIYSQKEILTHELAHVGRMSFPSSRFEELFAFQSSKRYRRILGPLFSSPNQSLTLVVLTSLSLLGDFLLQKTPYAWAFFKTLPLLYLGFLGLKLAWTRRYYQKALNKMKRLVKDGKKARYILYRLTEREIVKFSRSRLEKIEAYIEEQKAKELRWRLIYLAYLR